MKHVNYIKTDFNSRCAFWRGKSSLPLVNSGCSSRAKILSPTTRRQKQKEILSPGGERGAVRLHLPARLRPPRPRPRVPGRRARGARGPCQRAPSRPGAGEGRESAPARRRVASAARRSGEAAEGPGRGGLGRGVGELGRRGRTARERGTGPRRRQARPAGEARRGPPSTGAPPTPPSSGRGGAARRRRGPADPLCRVGTAELPAAHGPRSPAELPVALLAASLLWSVAQCRCSANAFEERGDVFLHLLSPRTQTASRGCLVCWMPIWCGTVTIGEAKMDLPLLLESV